MKEGTQGPRYLERAVLDSFLTFLLLSGRESTFLFASFSTVSSIVKAKASQHPHPAWIESGDIISRLHL